jgi:hypothetical protein
MCRRRPKSSHRSAHRHSSHASVRMALLQGLSLNLARGFTVKDWLSRVALKWRRKGVFDRSDAVSGFRSSVSFRNLPFSLGFTGG